MRQLYNEPHQHQIIPPTPYENLLGDSIERGFAQGFYDLDALVAYLNRVGPLGRKSEPWTTESFILEMKRLGQ